MELMGQRTDKELAAAVLQRACALRERKKRSVNLGMGAVSVACFSLICLFVITNGQSLGHRQGASLPAQGSAVELMGDASIGAYVIVGIAFFALGIVLTLIVQNAKEAK